MATRLVVALAAGLTIWGAADLGGQSGATPPARLSPQCYRLDVSAWQPGLSGNEPYHRLPTTVRLDTLSGPRGTRQLEPDIAYPYHRGLRNTPYWSTQGDSVRLVWSNGFQVTVVKLVRRGDLLVGDAIAESDDRPSPGAPSPRATVTAHPIPCVDSKKPNGVDRSVFTDSALFRQVCIEADSGLTPASGRCTPRDQRVRRP